MKLLSKIIDFVIVAMVFALIAALCFAKLEVRDAESVSQHLAQQVDSIQKDREKLAESLAQKEKELQTQAGLNDELRLEYEGTLKKFENLRSKHYDLLDSLKNIPPDTAFKALNEVYDFGDTLPRPYPFNAPQVKSMYSTWISDLQQKEQNSLLQKSYLDCGNLLNGLSKENELLVSVVAITKEDNKLLSSQNVIYKTANEDLSKKYSSSQKWNTIWKGVAAVLGLVAAFK
jgi:hypothetical protein